jgi:3-deoxy-D-manno-octulosonate 8-phosphate phosphatase (KDO 8-P phosphatase)
MSIKPALNFPAELLWKAQSVKVVLLDVDGVLTDGGLYYTEQGETLKRFNTLDGHGLKLLQKAEIAPAIITGREAKPLRARLASLGITHARYCVENKKQAAEEILKELNASWAQTAVMGDDWPDMLVMKACAFSCAPVNAHSEVKALASYVTNASGGAGALREFCDLLLMANGNYARLYREASQ